jgi:hypothetical protein
LGPYAASGRKRVLVRAGRWYLELIEMQMARLDDGNSERVGVVVVGAFEGEQKEQREVAE